MYDGLHFDKPRWKRDNVQGVGYVKWNIDPANGSTNEYYHLEYVQSIFYRTPGKTHTVVTNITPLINSSNPNFDYNKTNSFPWCNSSRFTLGNCPTPTPTPTPTNTATVGTSPTPTPTVGTSPTPTPTVGTIAPTPTATVGTSPTPTPSVTPSTTIGASPTPSPSVSHTPTNTPTNTATVGTSPTPTPTVGTQPTPTATVGTIAPTPTATVGTSPTPTPTIGGPNPTPSVTPSISVTPTNTATVGTSPTPTPTVGTQPTPTATVGTIAPTPTATVGTSPTPTPTNSPTPNPTPIPGPTPTPSPSPLNGHVEYIGFDTPAGVTQRLSTYTFKVKRHGNYPSNVTKPLVTFSYMTRSFTTVPGMPGVAKGGSYCGFGNDYISKVETVALQPDEDEKVVPIEICSDPNNGNAFAAFKLLSFGVSAEDAWEAAGNSITLAFPREHYIWIF